MLSARFGIFLLMTLSTAAAAWAVEAQEERFPPASSGLFTLDLREAPVSALVRDLASRGVATLLEGRKGDSSKASVPFASFLVLESELAGVGSLPDLPKSPARRLGVLGNDVWTGVDVHLQPKAARKLKPLLSLVAGPESGKSPQD